MRIKLKKHDYNFDNDYLEALFTGRQTKGKPLYDASVIKKFAKTIKILQFAENISEIRALKGLNFEALKGNLAGKYSVRVDIKYRLILRVEKDVVMVETVLIVEDLTNHYK